MIDVISTPNIYHQSIKLDASELGNPLVMANQGSVGQFIWIIFVQGSGNWLTNSWWNITYFGHFVDKMTALVGFLTCSSTIIYNSGL